MRGWMDDNKKELNSKKRQTKIAVLQAINKAISNDNVLKIMCGRWILSILQKNVFFIRMN